jgi:hypothetical protein
VPHARAPTQNAQANNEQHKLAAERNALIETVRKLNRDVAKLESFKKNLMQSLSDETEAWQQLARPPLPAAAQASVLADLQVGALAAGDQHVLGAPGGAGAERRRLVKRCDVRLCIVAR